MSTVQRNIRLTHLEDQDVMERAKQAGMSFTDYARMKLAEPDLAPHLRGMVEQLARNVGMTPFEVVERILADHFAFMGAAYAVFGPEEAHLHLGPCHLMKFKKTEVDGILRPSPIKDVYEMLLYMYTGRNREEDRKEQQDQELLAARIRAAEASESKAVLSKPKAATSRRKKS